MMICAENNKDKTPDVRQEEVPDREMIRHFFEGIADALEQRNADSLRHCMEEMGAYLEIDTPTFTEEPTSIHQMQHEFQTAAFTAADFLLNKGFEKEHLSFLLITSVENVLKVLGEEE